MLELVERTRFRWDGGHRTIVLKLADRTRFRSESEEAAKRSLRTAAITTIGQTAEEESGVRAGVIVDQWNEDDGVATRGDSDARDRDRESAGVDARRKREGAAVAGVVWTARGVTEAEDERGGIGVVDHVPENGDEGDAKGAFFGI